MKDPTADLNSPTSEISQFLRFLGSIWGLFAGISIFFPFINQLTESLQFPDHSVQGTSTALSLLSSAFVLLVIYLSRQYLSDIDDPNRRRSASSGYRKLPLAGYRVPAVAIIAFVFFIIFFADYVNATISGAYYPTNLDRSLVIGVLEYALLFSLATFSFGLLASSEYMKQINKLESQKARGWPYLESGMSALYQRLPPEERLLFNKFRILEESRIEIGNRRQLKIKAQSTRGPKYRQFEITIDEDHNVIDYKIIGGS